MAPLARSSRRLGEFDENPVGRLGMHECDAASTCAGAGRVINQAVSLLAACREGNVEIIDPVADVMDSRPAPGQKAADGRIGFKWFEQLDIRVAELKVHDTCAVGGLGATHGNAEHISVECEGGFDVRYGDSDVGNGRLHGDGT